MKRKSANGASSVDHNDDSARKRRRSVDVSESDVELSNNSDTNLTPSKLKNGRSSSGTAGEPFLNRNPTHSAVSDGFEMHNGNMTGGKESENVAEIVTPVKRGRGRPKGSKNLPKLPSATPTKADRTGKKLWATPKHRRLEAIGEASPSVVRNADRSARRKSARTLIERTMAGDLSDNDDEEDELARHIYDFDEEDAVTAEDGGASGAATETESAPVTPVKRGRGRPKGAKNRARSPTPPGDLPPHEHYFHQNRGGGAKTSNNTLASLALLDHEEYFPLIRKFRDPHTDDMDFLLDLHARSFHQWQFELSQDFNLCIYGWGSKRTLLNNFATHLYNHHIDHTSHKIVVINGYVHTTTIREIFNTVARAILGPEHTAKLGSQPTEMLESLSSLLAEDKEKHITLVVNSIDAVPLRRSATQNLLARLSTHPQISLIASADHPSFPLLWDSSLRSTYNFLFHDCTTFAPYDIEVDVVDSVHDLLGRSGRRVGGKEGVRYVLKSLPENGQNLFRVLVAEQLITMDDSNGMLGFDEEMDEDEDGMSRTNGLRQEVGVEYRVLYQKAVEEFICSSEMNFRTLLKE
jgi:origin recognition complex subunit 2